MTSSRLATAIMIFVMSLALPAPLYAKPVVNLGLAAPAEYRQPTADDQLELERLSESLHAAEQSRNLAAGTKAIEGMKAVFSRTYGKTHPVLIFADIRQAGLLFSCNSVPQAEALVKTTVEKLDKQLGTYNDFSAFSYALLGKIHQYNQRYELAKFYQEKSLGIYMIIIKGDRRFVPYTATAYDALGTNLIYTGQWELGIDYIKNAIALSGVDIGGKLPIPPDEVLRYRIHIVQALRQGGQFTKAITEAGKISEDAKTTFGSKGSDYIRLLKELAIAQAAAGDTSNAFSNFEKVRTALWDTNSLEYYEAEYEYALAEFNDEYTAQSYQRLDKLQKDIHESHGYQTDPTSSRRLTNTLADVQLLLSRATAQITFSESTPARTAKAAFSYAQVSSELAYGQLSRERGRMIPEGDFDEIQNQISPTLSAGGLNPNHAFYGNFLERADDFRSIGGVALGPVVENRLFALAQEMTLAPSVLDSTAASYSRHQADPAVSQMVHEHQSLLRKLQKTEVSLGMALQEADTEGVAEALDAIPDLHRNIVKIHSSIQKSEWDKDYDIHKKDRSFRSPMNVEYTALFNFHGSEYSRTQKYLAKNEALILTATYNGDLYIFVLTSAGKGNASGFQWKRLKGGEKSVSDRVTKLLCQIDRDRCSPGTDQQSGEAFDLTAASTLYQDLFGSFDEQLRDVDHIYSVMSGALAELPLSILVTDAVVPESLEGASWLADRFTIVSLPSVSSLAYDHTTTTKAGKRSNPVFAGFGGPDLSPARMSSLNGSGKTEWFISNSRNDLVANPRKLASLGSVAGARDELIMVASSLGLFGTDALNAIHTDAEAREGSFRTSPDVRRSSVVAIATHGLLPNRHQKLLEPGLVFTPPQNPTSDDDGLLTASEIFTMRFDADWIILSACNTATSDSSNDSLSTLSRAFLFSGARSLLASRWRVSDEATQSLISQTLSAYKSGGTGVSKAKALQAAMKNVRLSSEGQFAHPRFWAPFLIVATRND